MKEIFYVRLTVDTKRNIYTVWLSLITKQAESVLPLQKLLALTKNGTRLGTVRLGPVFIVLDKCARFPQECRN
jgi:hypothetical protein